MADSNNLTFVLMLLFNNLRTAKRCKLLIRTINLCFKLRNNIFYFVKFRNLFINLYFSLLNTNKLKKALLNYTSFMQRLIFYFADTTSTHLPLTPALMVLSYIADVYVPGKKKRPK